MNKPLKYLQRVTIFMLRNILAVFMKIIFSVVPLQKNKIFMMSYSGTKYSCNPKALTDYILENNEDFNIVWGFNKQFINEIQLPKSITKVAFYTIGFFYH